MATPYGNKEKLIVKIGPLDATSVAVNQTHFIVPDNKCAYEVESIQSVQGTASSSGTVKLRVIRDTSAANASAGTNVIELVNNAGANTISTASTAATVVNNTKVSGVKLYAGNRICSLSGGTQTNLVGFTAVLVLTPVETGL